MSETLPSASRSRPVSARLTLASLPAATARAIILLSLLALFCLFDWGLLRALPLLRLSFSATIQLALAVSAMTRILMLGGLVWVPLATRALARNPANRGAPSRVMAAFLVGNLLFTAVEVDAYIVEPLWIGTTHLSFSYADLDPAAAPLRVVHLTDIHVERNSYREASLVRQVNALRPDLIVLTGDYLNLSRLADPVSVAHFRELIGQLQAPYGIYAVRGSLEPTMQMMARLVERIPIVWLEQEAVTLDVRGQQVTLVGVACSGDLELDRRRLELAMHGVPEEAFTLLLYHSPDLIAEAARLGVDLFLAGHTHGGQVRVPLYGALFTGSVYGRRYVAGLAELDGTRLYISRGVGFEGGGVPRARLLCRPEIVSVDLQG